MKLNRTPSLHDRNWRNAENENWQKIEGLESGISKKIDDFTEYLEDSMGLLLDGVLTVKFEKNSWWNNGNPDDNNPLRMRATRSYNLTSGTTINTTASNEYEYNLIFHSNGTWTGDTLGWTSFGTPYVLEEDKEVYIIARKKPESVITDSDIENVNRLFGGIEIEGVADDTDGSGLFEFGSFYFGSSLNYDPGQRIRQIESIPLTKGSYINTTPNSSLEFRAYGYVNGEYRTDSPGFTEFGTPLEIGFDADYRILVRPKPDDREFTQADLNYVNNNLYFSGETSSNTMSQFDIVDDIEHEFEPFNLYDYHTQPNDVSANELYGEYERIRNLDTTYIKRSTIGSSVENNPIYAYTAKPINLDGGGRGTTGVQPVMPKILIVAGVHGDERSTAFSTMELLELVTTKWKENKLLEFLRFNVEFIIIPLVNPDGFNRSSRRNANNVDLNRDMPEAWSRVSSGYAQNGTAPLSQPETRTLNDFFLDNKDISLSIDFHTTSIIRDGGQQQLGYASTSISKLSKTMNKSLLKTSRKWKREYSYLPQNPNTKLMYVGDSPVGGSVSRQATAYGINATLLEMARSIEASPEGLASEYTETINTMTTELLVESIKSWLKAYAL